MQITDITIRTLARPQKGAIIYYDDDLVQFGPISFCMSFHRNRLLTKKWQP
jgi:hypothetical protein